MKCNNNWSILLSAAMLSGSIIWDSQPLTAPTSKLAAAPAVTASAEKEDILTFYEAAKYLNIPEEQMNKIIFIEAQDLEKNGIPA